MLSPSVFTFGKPPLSVYERAFDAIAAIRESGQVESNTKGEDFKYTSWRAAVIFD
ncbi:hypothetical protein D3C77_273890 [compost metagenome]